MALHPVRRAWTKLQPKNIRNIVQEPACICSQGAALYSSFATTSKRPGLSLPNKRTPGTLRWQSTSMPRDASLNSVSADEMNHFASLAASWWDPQGSSRILHLMNPLRHEWIAGCLSEGARGVGRHEGNQGGVIQGLDYLDIGCGGGIFAESLARTIPQDITHDGVSTVTQARSITAIDPTPMMIRIATGHAQQDPAVSSHLKTGKFKYLNTSLERLPAALSTPSPKYDIITLFEVLEHVSQHSSQPEFLKQILSMLRPGGWLIGSTMARAFPAYVLHNVIAEAPWPIGVVPKGTHDWYRFVNPSEVKQWSEKGLRDLGREASEGVSVSIAMARFKSTGAVYLPGLGWKRAECLDDYGNYFFAVQRT